MDQEKIKTFLFKEIKVFFKKHPEHAFVGLLDYSKAWNFRLSHSHFMLCLSGNKRIHFKPCDVLKIEAT